MTSLDSIVSTEAGRPVRQLVQSVRSGELSLTEIPIPSPSPTEVLVATSRSVVSAGTERAVNELASASLLQKAKARPDLVRQVVTKARADGVRRTADAVRSRLDDMMPLGYSGAGVAVEVGEYVQGVRPGMRVATGGAGHGDYQLSAGLLTAPIPDQVSDENAAFATVASIALHGLRLAELGPGARICVIGLGLVGQITCRLAQASGYLVSGIDVKDFAVGKAATSGVFALSERGDATTRSITEWSKGRGVDAVLITAATKSSEPVTRSTTIARDRASIVVVGDVGLELDRRPFYEHELTLRVARSYGPGRYERSYEEWGIDYPAGQVRWTEGRNLEAVLDLLATGQVDFSDLITHRFELDHVAKAYEVIAGPEPYFGVQLTYPEPPIDLRPTQRTISVGRHATASAQATTGLTQPRIGLLGAGNFVRATLLPAIKEAELGPIEVICSTGGASARFLADKNGIPRVATDASEVINDPSVDLVMIATPHDTHADLVVEALDAGKHVFCEKPLALAIEDLDRIEAAWQACGKVLQVGFNRRFAPAAVKAKEILGGSGAPLVLTYRVNAGELPTNHWYHDRRFGGRLTGEACHFIDLCGFFADDALPKVHTWCGSNDATATPNDFVISLRYPNGSLATISYGSGGHPAMPKERIEIVGRGHSLVIDDFTTLAIDGRRPTRLSGRGHAEQLLHFQHPSTSQRHSGSSALRSMRTTLAADRLLARDAGLSATRAGA